MIIYHLLIKLSRLVMFLSAFLVKYLKYQSKVIFNITSLFILNYRNLRTNLINNIKYCNELTCLSYFVIMKSIKKPASHFQKDRLYNT